MAHLSAIVKGRVQGVGFRYFVYDKARRLGLRGFVRNLPNGDVQVVAEGSEEDLQTLLQSLWKGPAFAKVLDVQTSQTEDEQGFSDFQILI